MNYDKTDFEAWKEAAKRTDPTALLTSMGMNVKRSGRHMSVRQGEKELYRITLKPDGNYVWCDHGGAEGGDNIKLIRRLNPGASFTEALTMLTGQQPDLSKVNIPPPPPAEPQYPRIPMATPDDVAAGREYLQNRRQISMQTIKAAEDCGMLGYCPGGVLFLGRWPKELGGKICNAARRAIDDGEAVPKRDFKNSDKSYPPVFYGANKSRVWIVEGGTDALALSDIYLRRGKPAPLIIVSGGAHIRSFFYKPHINYMLNLSRSITIACEKEKNDETQKNTDAAHAKQAALIEEITGKRPDFWWPPPGMGKDLAEYNARLLQSRNHTVQQPGHPDAGISEGPLPRPDFFLPFGPMQPPEMREGFVEVPPEEATAILWKNPPDIPFYQRRRSRPRPGPER